MVESLVPADHSETVYILDGCVCAPHLQRLRSDDPREVSHLQVASRKTTRAWHCDVASNTLIDRGTATAEDVGNANVVNHCFERQSERRSKVTVMHNQDRQTTEQHRRQIRVADVRRSGTAARDRWQRVEKWAPDEMTRIQTDWDDGMNSWATHSTSRRKHGLTTKLPC